MDFSGINQYISIGLIVEKIITKSFARLMGRGVHRGFITHEELFKS